MQAQFNCSYFQFDYYPESVLPLSVLQCWHQLIIDIRYCINMEIRRSGKKESIESDAVRRVSRRSRVVDG